MKMLGKVRWMYFRDKLSCIRWPGVPSSPKNRPKRPKPLADVPTGAAFNKLSPFYKTLEQALKANLFRVKHNRRCVKALFEQIKPKEHDGGYSQPTAFIHLYNGEQGKHLRAYAPRPLALGECFQLDWSEIHEMLLSTHTARLVL
jgi:hypothetical protein